MASAQRRTSCNRRIAVSGSWRRRAHPSRYDLIFLDPPTFSNSKRMEGVLDIERDHAGLIEAAARLLAPHGLLIFSTNSQRFKLDSSVAERYGVADISMRTVPPDFVRNPRIHRCFEIRLPGESATTDP